MGNILVLGNGFDLYHGLKTKYYDFVQFVKNPPSDTEERARRICSQNIFLQYFIKVCEINDKWIDCEEEIEKVILVLQKAVDIQSNKENRKLYNDEISDIEEVIIGCLEKYGSLDDKKYFIFNEEYFNNNVFNKKKFLEDFRRELKEVIEALCGYLDKELSAKEINIKCPQIADKEFEIVVNFNYTDTYERVYSKPYIMFYQHGSLSQSQTVVLGIPDNDDVSQDFIYFKKYFQRIQKRTGIFKKVLSNFGGPKKLNTAYFFGMSMGKTDGDLIKEIMHKSSKNIIFYYDQDDYEGKVINLIDVFGRKKVEKWLNNDKIKFEELKKV